MAACRQKLIVFCYRGVSEYILAPAARLGSGRGAPDSWGDPAAAEGSRLIPRRAPGSCLRCCYGHRPCLGSCRRHPCRHLVCNNVRPSRRQHLETCSRPSCEVMQPDHGPREMFLPTSSCNNKLKPERGLEQFPVAIGSCRGLEVTAHICARDPREEGSKTKMFQGGGKCRLIPER